MSSTASGGRVALRRARALMGNEAAQVGALLLLALLLRLALHFRAPAFVGKDSQSYYLPGWSIAHLQPFELGQRRTPGYPLFIAGSILLLGEDLRSLALLQHVAGVATVGLSYLLGRLTFGRAAGLLGGVLVALSGPLLLYERYVMSEALFGLLLALTAVLATCALRRPGPKIWLAVGLALGCAILARPVAQVLLPIVALAALLSAGGRWRRAAWSLGLLALGVALIQGPWVLRNALEKGNAAASTFGRTLIARTAYYDRGFVFDPPCRPNDDPTIARARQIVQDGFRQRQSDGVIAGRIAQDLGLDPVQRNRVMRDVAVAAILCDPAHYAQTTAQFAWQIFAGTEERLRDHWDEWKDANPWDERIRPLVGPASAAEEAERPTASRLAGLYQPSRIATPLLGLALLGTLGALTRREGRALLLAAGLAACLLVASAALDGPVERYRYPLDPLLAALVGAGAITLWRALARAVASLRPAAPAPAPRPVAPRPPAA